LNYLDNIRIRALTAVVDPDHDAIMRRIFRWYSEKFHTPLHVVEDDLPLDHVLLHYFEHEFEGLDEAERHNLAIELLETPEERAERAAMVAADEDEFLKKASAANEKIKAKIAKAGSALRSLIEQKNKATAPKPLPVNRAPSTPTPDPEEVTITYKSTEDFEADLEPKLPPRRKPQ
jgi:hypothetical protein